MQALKNELTAAEMQRRIEHARQAKGLPAVELTRIDQPSPVVRSQEHRCKRCGAAVPDPETIGPFTLWPQYCAKCQPIMDRENEDKENEWQRREAAEMAREEAKRIAEYEVSIPPGYRKAETKQLAEGIPAAIGQWYSDPDAWGAYLYGTPGCGKTYAAYALMNDLFNQPNSVTVTFWRCITLTRTLAMTAGKGMDELATLIDKMVADNRLLIIDDIGAGKLTPFAEGEILNILDERMLWKRKTLMTGNLSLKELVGRLDDRILDRLATATLIRFTGGSRRLMARRK